MGVRVIRRFCSNCGQTRPFEKQGVNHVLHLILSLLTLGVWVVVWMMAGVCNTLSLYRCRECAKGIW